MSLESIRSSMYLDVVSKRVAALGFMRASFPFEGVTTMYARCIRRICMFSRTTEPSKLA